jgi:hypothetical protein
MATYLFGWDPEGFDWTRLPYLLHLSSQGWPVIDDWCCGKRKTIRDGDLFYLAKCGTRGGIMASGQVISPEAYRPKAPKATHETALYVDLSFDVLLDPDTEPLLALTTLERKGLVAPAWSIKMPVVRLAADSAPALERLWHKHVAGLRTS